MLKEIIKTKQIQVPPYGDYVTFVYSNSYDKIIGFAKRDSITRRDLKDLESRDYVGYHLPLEKGGYYLVVMKNSDKYEEIDTITHEVDHLVTDILHDAGVRVSRKNDEAHAHLTGYLNKEFFKFKDGK